MGNGVDVGTGVAVAVGVGVIGIGVGVGIEVAVGVANGTVVDEMVGIGSGASVSNGIPQFSQCLFASEFRVLQFVHFCFPNIF